MLCHGLCSLPSTIREMGRPVGGPAERPSSAGCGACWKPGAPPGPSSLALWLPGPQAHGAPATQSCGSGLPGARPDLRPTASARRLALTLVPGLRPCLRPRRLPAGWRRSPGWRGPREPGWEVCTPALRLTPDHSVLSRTFQELPSCFKTFPGGDLPPRLTHFLFVLPHLGAQGPRRVRPPSPPLTHPRLRAGAERASRCLLRVRVLPSGLFSETL